MLVKFMLVVLSLVLLLNTFSCLKVNDYCLLVNETAGENCNSEYEFKCNEYCTKSNETCHQLIKFKESLEVYSQGSVLESFFTKHMKLRVKKCTNDAENSFLDFNSVCKITTSQCVNRVLVNGILFEIKHANCKCKSKFKYRCGKTNYCASSSRACYEIRSLMRSKNIENRVKSCF